jgi:hypothetical protein
MVLQMFDFKGHSLANRLIVGSNDGGTTSFDLQHQKKYVVIVIFILQASVLSLNVFPINVINIIISIIIVLTDYNVSAAHY